MTTLEEALLELTGTLDELNLPYILIGGLAVSLLGEPRGTLDVDLSVWAAPERLVETVELLCSRFPALPSNPVEFVNHHRVLPIAAANRTRVDLVFASIALEREMIARGIAVQVGGHPVRIASVEDLVFMKLVSTRLKDRADAEALLRRYGRTLDRAYLLPKLQEVAQALDRPDILDLFRAAT